MTDDAPLATKVSGPAGDGAARPAAIILPHRAQAILRFSLVALGCCVVTGLIALALRTGLVLADSSEGALLLYLGLLAAAAYLVLGGIAWSMASRDLRLMDQGRADPAGRRQTRTGRMIAEALTVATVVFALALTVVFLRTFQV